MGLIVRSLNIEHGMIGSMVNLSWPNPTRPDDILYVKTEIQDIKPSKSKPYQAVVEVNWIVKNQKDDILLKTNSTTLMFYEYPTNHSKNS